MYRLSPASQRRALALIIGAAFALAGCQKPASDAAATSAPAPTPAASAAPGTAPYTAPSAAQLTQLVAPIALFPDKLLAQILAGSTYPDQLAEAALWRQRNASLKPADMAAASNVQRWDPSVKSLTAFPSVLAQLAGNPDWSRALGEAYVNEPGAVMNAIQALRQQAMAHGKLKSSAQLHVSVAQAPTVQYAVPDQPSDPAYPRPAPPPPALSQIIEIAPAQPDTVYVPEYDPQYVYGETVQPYPGYHYRVDGTVPNRDREVGRDALLFGTGVLVGVVAGRDRDPHWNAWGMNWTPRPDHDGARDRARETGPDRDRTHDDGRDGHRSVAVAPGVTYNNSPYVSRSTTIVNNNVNSVRTVNNVNNVTTVNNDNRGTTRAPQAAARGVQPAPAPMAGPTAPARPAMDVQAPEQHSAQPTTAPGAIAADERRQHREPLRLGAPEAQGTPAHPASPNVAGVTQRPGSPGVPEVPHPASPTPAMAPLNPRAPVLPAVPPTAGTPGPATAPHHRELPPNMAAAPHPNAPAAPAAPHHMHMPDEAAIPPRPAGSSIPPGRMQHEPRQAPVAAPAPASAPMPAPHAEATGMHRGANAAVDAPPMPHPQAVHPAPAAQTPPGAGAAAPHVAAAPTHGPAGTPGVHEGRHRDADGNVKPEPAK